MKTEEFVSNIEDIKKFALLIKMIYADTYSLLKSAHDLLEKAKGDTEFSVSRDYFGICFRSNVDFLNLANEALDSIFTTVQGIADFEPITLPSESLSCQKSSIDDQDFIFPLEKVKTLELVGNSELKPDNLSVLEYPSKERTVRMTLDLAESVHYELSVICAKSGKKKSDVLRDLLFKALFANEAHSPLHTKPNPCKVVELQSLEIVKPVEGKRNHSEYAQAGAYIPKSLKKEVMRECAEMEIEFSDLVTTLLTAWLQSKSDKAA